MEKRKRNSITTEIAYMDAEKCKTRSEFGVRFSGSWRHLSNKELLDDACGHMIGNTIWNYELAEKEAKKYKRKKDFKKGSPKAYQHCQRKDILSEVCSHMRKNIIWNPELVAIEAKKYKHRGEFSEGNGSAYSYCLKKDLLDEVCGHMTSGRKYKPPKNGRKAGRRVNLKAKIEEELRQILCFHKWSKPRKYKNSINSKCSKCGKKRSE
jgi:hypothetical protein